jgi:NADH-quinone oxidoreductase subunit L
MFRLYFLTFEGEYRGHAHPHEAGWEITVPLWILAGLSILAAVVGTPWWPQFSEFTGEAMALSPTPEPESINFKPYIIALTFAWLGWTWARAWYGKGLAPEGDPLMQRWPGFARASAHKFWIDELYNAVIVRPLWNGAQLLYKFVDVVVIDRVFVNGAAWVTSLIAKLTSPFENGDLSRYAALTALAVVGLIVWAVV